MLSTSMLNYDNYCLIISRNVAYVNIFAYDAINLLYTEYNKWEAKISLP